MDRPDILFTPQQIAQMQPVYNAARKAFWLIPFLVFTTAFFAVLQGLVGLVEWELMFRVFEYLAGDGYQFFSPHLMAFTGILMIVGYHLLAENQPDNIAVKIVSRVSQALILAYAIGAGVYLSRILIDSGLGESGSLDIEAMMGSLDNFNQQSWLEILFSKFAGPSGAMVLAVGVGGLGIVNLYISHALISRITKNIVDIRDRKVRYKAIQSDYQTVLDCQKQYAEITNDLGDLEMLDRDYISLEIASETLDMIAQNLARHEQEYQRLIVEPEGDRFDGQTNKTDLKEIKKSIDGIRKISLNDILKVLNTPKLPE